MSFLRNSLAKQTTQTSGTGTLTLIANAGDTRSLQSALGSGPVKCRAMLRGQGYFEMFRGTFTAPSTLTRDEVLLSSNTNSLVTVPAGTTDVYLLDYAEFVVDTFSGTSKTLANADASNTWLFTGSAQSTLTLPTLANALPDFWGMVRNSGTASVVLTAQGSDTIDESGTQTVKFAAGSAAYVFYDLANSIWRVIRVQAALSTRQVLTSGTSYTTPAGCRQLRIRMLGAGGGGALFNGGTNGSAGGDTSFNSIVAKGGGGGGGTTAGGIGGSGGSGGSSPNTIRYKGNDGQSGGGAGSGGNVGGYGGASFLGGVNYNQGSAAANTGSGGTGQFGSAGLNAGGGGGCGELVEMIINNPAATYTYSIGAGGAQGGVNAGNGGSGVIIVDEFY